VCVWSTDGSVAGVFGLQTQGPKHGQLNCRVQGHDMQVAQSNNGDDIIDMIGRTKGGIINYPVSIRISQVSLSEIMFK
jgi:hypothetical protein